MIPDNRFHQPIPCQVDPFVKRGSIMSESKKAPNIFLVLDRYAQIRYSLRKIVKYCFTQKRSSTTVVILVSLSCPLRQFLSSNESSDILRISILLISPVSTPVRWATQRHPHYNLRRFTYLLHGQESTDCKTPFCDELQHTSAGRSAAGWFTLHTV